MSQTNIKGVLIDLDGTLIDAFGPIIRAMRETLKAFDLPPLSDEDIRRHTGKGDCSMSALFGERKAEASEHFVKVHDEDYLTGIIPLAGAEPLLHWMKAEAIPVAVVTSKGQHRAEAQLEMLGWLEHFDCIIGKVEGRESKPSPVPLQLACEQLNLPISEVVMIGDGEADMKAAKRAGCLAAGLTHSFSVDELTQHGADHCFTSLEEVMDWLKKRKV